MIICECGGEYEIDLNESGYDSEIVLRCDKCKCCYYNAQEFFTKEKLNSLKIIPLTNKKQEVKKEMVKEKKYILKIRVADTFLKSGATSMKKILKVVEEMRLISNQYDIIEF